MGKGYHFLGHLEIPLIFCWPGWATSHHHYLAESATKECTEVRQVRGKKTETTKNFMGI